MENNTNQELLEKAKLWSPPQQKPKGKKSKLLPYIETIRYMRMYRHFSYKQIHEFILDSGTQVSYNNFLIFVRNLKKRKKK